MANMPRAVVRAEPDLIREAAERAGMADAPVSVVVRYALAVVAGKPDPHDVAIVRRGRRPRVESAA